MANTSITDFRRIALAYLDADPTKKMAVAVLGRAFTDLGKTKYVSAFRREYAYREEVSAWVSGRGGSFEFWCDAADIRVEIVRGWFETKLTLLNRYNAVSVERTLEEIEKGDEG